MGSGYPGLLYPGEYYPELGPPPSFEVPGIARASAISMLGPVGSDITMVSPGASGTSMTGPVATDIGTE